MSANLAAAAAGPSRGHFTRARTAAAAVLHEVWEIMHAPANLRIELLRMADHCEATQPEQAARLRQVAGSSWGE